MGSDETRERPGQQLPRAKRDAKRKRPGHQLRRAKRDAEIKRPVHQLLRAKRDAKMKRPDGYMFYGTTGTVGTACPGVNNSLSRVPSRVPFFTTLSPASCPGSRARIRNSVPVPKIRDARSRRPLSRMPTSGGNHFSQPLSPETSKFSAKFLILPDLFPSFGFFSKNRRSNNKIKFCRKGFPQIPLFIAAVSFHRAPF